MIHYVSYEKFLQKLAVSNWKKHLPLETLACIFELTECHAYYFNRLCQKLWALKNIPSFKEVQQCWSLLTEEEYSSIALELSSLTKNQRIVLQTLAKYKILKEPTGVEFLRASGLSHRSVTIALETLNKIDLVEHSNEGYKLIDPMMKHILAD